MSDCSKNNLRELRKLFGSPNTSHMCRHSPIISTVNKVQETACILSKLIYRVWHFTPAFSSVHKEFKESFVSPEKVEKMSTCNLERGGKEINHPLEGRPEDMGWGGGGVRCTFSKVSNNEFNIQDRTYVLDIWWKVSVNVQHGLFLQVSVKTSNYTQHFVQ